MLALMRRDVVGRFFNFYSVFGNYNWYFKIFVNYIRFDWVVVSDVCPSFIHY